MLRLLLASIFGAIVAFVWGFISWELVGWHAPLSFTDADAVSKTLVENAPDHGLYMLPAAKENGPNVEKLTEGPFLYAYLRPGKLDQPWSFGMTLAKNFAVNVTACLLISICVLRIRANRYISRASIGLTLGLFAAVSAVLPHGVWFELNNRHLLAQFLDPIIAYTLAGLLIAVLIKPPKRKKIFS